MVEETMTLRKALQERKLLDKQIEDTKVAEFFAVSTANEFVYGLSVNDYEKKVLAEVQSLNAKILRREALNKAIMLANATESIVVPKLDGLKATTETEKVNFATAIGRKAFYEHILDTLLMRIATAQQKATNEYSKAIREVDTKITERMNMEFSGATNIGNKQRQEREEQLEEQYKVTYLDVYGFGSSLWKTKELVEKYLLDIDSSLGSATETTIITIRY